jgi:DNA-binding transcriptional LysR family regulator
MSEQIETRLKLRQFALVCAIRETGSLRRAADKLNMTQSAATKSLRGLEANLKTKLFRRTSAGMSILPAGEAFANDCRTVLSDIRSSIEGLHELAEGKAGQVVVGMLASAQSLIPDALAHMIRTRPQVSVHLLEGTTEMLIAELVGGKIDLLVGRLPIPSAGTRTEEEILYEDPIRLVCRADHPLTKQGVVEWKDTLAYGWVLPVENSHGQRHIHQQFQRMGLRPPTPLVVTSSSMTRLAVLVNTDLIGVLAQRPAVSHARSGALHILDLELSGTFSPVGLVTRRGAILSPATKGFCEALRAVAQRHDL